MSDCEEKPERNVEILREKLHVAIEKKKHNQKSLNYSSHGVKVTHGRMVNGIKKLKRNDVVDYEFNSDGDKVITSYKKR